MNKSKAIIIGICLSVVCVMGVCGFNANHTEKTYGVDGTITAIESCGSITEIYTVDSDGMAYSFYADDADSYKVNDSVRLIMSNSATPDRYDDAVIGAVVR